MNSVIHFDPNAVPDTRGKKYRGFIFKMLMLTLSAFLIALNTKTFIRAGNLVPGGVTGLTVLIQRIAEKYFSLRLPFAPINILLNAFPIYVGLKFLGRQFTMYSVYVILMSSVLTDLIKPHAITSDMLLITVFGALLGGFASSLSLLSDATTGGTDFISTYLSVRKGMDGWNVILGFNVVLLGISGLLFGWDKALYSIIYQYVVTQVLQNLYRRYQQQTLFIVTEHPMEVSKAIYETSHHGATVLNGTGTHVHTDRSVLYSVVSRAEATQVMNEVRKADPDALVNAIRTEQFRGNFYQRPIK